MSIFSSIKNFKHFLPPLKEVLSEDGIGSYSRYSGFIVIVATIAWVTYLTIHNSALPDLGGPAMFMGAGQAQYAANQAKKVASAWKGGNPDPTPVNVQGDQASVVVAPKDSDDDSHR